MKEKLAIIGTGIAGMGAAHLLQNHFDLTLFEKNNYIGGHTNTVFVEEDGIEIPIDTGFMVFNKQTYPHLIQLFEQLQVPIKKTSMSFSVQHKTSGLEYCGSGLSGLFAQKKNIFSPRYIKMLWQINRFNKESIQDLNNGHLGQFSIADYTKLKGYNQDFMEKYLLPMSSAIWSTPPGTSLKFPAESLVRFFKNHGMLGLDTHFQWYTVENGSESYKKRLIAPFINRIKTNSKISSVKKVKDQIEVHCHNGERYLFDKVIVAAHANEALRMLSKPTDLQQNLLSKFQYQENLAVLHSDTGVMPKNKKVWSSWNYLIDRKNGENRTTTIYNMNSLQNVSEKEHYFVSINPIDLNEKKIHKVLTYFHPIFTLESFEAQKRLQELNSDGSIYFCGSYFRYGFHEDAYASAVQLANKILHEENRIQLKAG
ncbi:NAD(P)/FAD-dependent oxidoreductase [Marinifilum caeruleilacunae]|uniref:NADP transhydrogenase subunit alpha n=1 Tax=Marinifilum caeruleilacunae TaxID=2499076 RepID=A0ABX1WYF9_9BACT|nr:FAD-dependent oxidoreductase [Marinifilum caeruleilacunae]NOU61183.1 NADP transhydrogenase subunit alpha [Marinifilum caeruleilacunae]